MSYFNYIFMKYRVFSFSALLIGLSAILSPIQTTSTERKDLVKDLKTRILEDGFSIELTWTPPEEEGEIIIARSKERMDTPEKLYYADSLGRYPNRKEESLRSFKDINLRPGTYYYAVVMVSRIKKRDVELVPNENYTLGPVDIGTPVQFAKDVPRENLPYAHDNAHSVTDIEIKHYRTYNQIRWVAPLNSQNSKPSYHIYRSEEPLSSLPLLKKAEKLVELYHPDNFYVDKSVVPGKVYYYGISVSIKGQEFLPLVENKSFARSHRTATSAVVPTKNVTTESQEDNPPTKKEVTTPKREDKNPNEKKVEEELPSKKEVALSAEEDKKPNSQTQANLGKSDQPPSKKDPETNPQTEKENKPTESEKKEEASDQRIQKNPESNLEFERIMTDYYRKRNFNKARTLLENYVKREKDPEQRAKGLFYVALCYYNTGIFDKALKILLREELKTHYNKERVEFYINRCVEKQARNE